MPQGRLSLLGALVELAASVAQEPCENHALAVKQW